MKVIFLCTYPIGNPTHGGMHRARAIVNHYRSLGHEVRVAGVIGSDQYPKEDGFIEFPGRTALATVAEHPFLIEDFCIAKLFGGGGEWFERLVGKLSDFRNPEVIHVEQPWLFDFAMLFRERVAPGARLIYGSQNIEADLKRSIAIEYFDSARADECCEFVRQVELRAIKQADAIVAVSEQDRLWISERADVPVILAPNGVHRWQVTEDGRREARTHSCGRAYALFTASAHPPNIAGFFNIFSGGFGSLRPDEKLILAGGIGWTVEADDRVHASAKLAEKLVLAGFVSEICLAALIDEAHCLVLPITEGGGTNLKTAEALWAGKHIVATPTAMRGFEAFSNARGVTIADNPAAFKRALRAAMHSEPLLLTAKEREQRSVVLWEQCLRPLDSVLAQPSPDRIAQV